MAHHYVEFKGLYKGLKTNQKPKFYCYKNSREGILPNSIKFTAIGPLKSENNDFVETKSVEKYRTITFFLFTYLFYFFELEYFMYLFTYEVLF